MSYQTGNCEPPDRRAAPGKKTKKEKRKSHKFAVETRRKEGDFGYLINCIFRNRDWSPYGTCRTQIDAENLADKIQRTCRWLEARIVTR